MGKENQPKRLHILWTMLTEVGHFVKNMEQAVSVSDTWLSGYHAVSLCNLPFFVSPSSSTVYNKISTFSCSATACISCPTPWVRLCDKHTAQPKETTACVMLSIVCSPLGSFLTKTKILFAKFMGVEEKVRWLLGLWCFCHYRKVCSVRYVQ